MTPANWQSRNENRARFWRFGRRISEAHWRRRKSAPLLPLDEVYSCSKSSELWSTSQPYLTTRRSCSPPRPLCSALLWAPVRLSVTDWFVASLSARASSNSNKSVRTRRQSHPLSGPLSAPIREPAWHPNERQHGRHLRRVSSNRSPPPLLSVELLADVDEKEAVSWLFGRSNRTPLAA